MGASVATLVPSSQPASLRASARDISSLALIWYGSPSGCGEVHSPPSLRILRRYATSYSPAWPRELSVRPLSTLLPLTEDSERWLETDATAAACTFSRSSPSGENAGPSVVVTVLPWALRRSTVAVVRLASAFLTSLLSDAFDSLAETGSSFSSTAPRECCAARSAKSAWLMAVLVVAGPSRVRRLSGETNAVMSSRAAVPGLASGNAVSAQSSRCWSVSTSTGEYSSGLSPCAKVNSGGSRSGRTGWVMLSGARHIRPPRTAYVDFSGTPARSGVISFLSLSQLFVSITTCRSSTWTWLLSLPTEVMLVCARFSVP